MPSLGPLDALDPLGDSADPRCYVPLDTSECALHALADALRGGRSPVLLAGESGVGKTILLRVLADRARAQGQRAIFSPFLHLPPDDVSPWLLHLLGRELGEGETADAALAAELRAAGRPTLLLIDEVQSAPAASLERLRALADGAAVVAAGSRGDALAARLPALEPASIIDLPATLPDADLAALCDAILDHAALPPELRRLSRHARAELVQSAFGLPMRLKAELACRARDLALREPALEPEPELELGPDLDAELELELESELDASALELELDLETEPELELQLDAGDALELETDVGDAQTDFDAETWLQRQPDVRDALEEIVWQLEPAAPDAVDELDLSDWPDPSHGAATAREPGRWRSAFAASRERVGLRALAVASAVRGGGRLAGTAARRARSALGRSSAGAARRVSALGRDGLGAARRAGAALRSRTAATAFAARRAGDTVWRRGADAAARASGLAHAGAGAVQRTRAGVGRGAREVARRAKDGAARGGANAARRSAAAAQRARAASSEAGAQLAARARAADARGRASLRAARARLPRAETLAAGIALLALAAAAAQHDPRDEPVPTVAAAQPALPESEPILPDVSAPPPPLAVASLAPPVQVQVNARPWARIRVDGADVGPTPLSHQLSPGRYEFEAEFPDGRTLRRQIEIGPEHRFVRFP